VPTNLQHGPDYPSPFHARDQLSRFQEIENGARALSLSPDILVTDVVVGTHAQPAILLTREDAEAVVQAIRATVVMRTMLEAQGIAYVHVLQPNQYYTSRRFTPEESAVAINAASPFKSGVERGYPALLAEAAAQALEARTGFFDATRIFDAEAAPVYVDDCCHYTRVGYLRLADFLARAVMTVAGPWRSEPSP
jgi:hypothetical protein